MSLNATLNATMRAVAYLGTPYSVSVIDLPIPTLQSPTDAIIRVSTAAICGSDLHYYHGTFGVSSPPWYMGHEAVGYVQSIGDGVTQVDIGDRVVIPDITAAEDPLTLTNLEGPAFGVGGDLGGCQAEYVRVPRADQNLFVIPAINVSTTNSSAANATAVADLDWLMLSDVFNTGWTGLDFAGFYPGETVAIFGAGPVGLASAYSAVLRGASRVYSIDHVASRLEKAASIGAIPINFMESDPVDQILASEPDGVVRTVDAVGYEAINSNGEHQENVVINQMIRLTMTAGGMGGLGVFGTAHQNNSVTAWGALAKPNITFDMGMFWSKQLTLRSGGVDALEYTPHLAELIADGTAHPGLIFSSIVDIEDAPEAYRAFSDHEEEKIAINFPGAAETARH